MLGLAKIGKRFPGVLALDDVSLVLNAGEIHALAGENGSGKSMLVRIAAGLARPDVGRIEIDGREVAFSTPRDAIDEGVVAISQELTLAPSLTVAENVLLGRLPRTRSGLVSWSRAACRARELLERSEIAVDPRARVRDLTIELQQEIEIVRAIAMDPRVLILDEPTSSLSEVATRRLLATIEELRRRGVAILFISHRLRETYACASRATVLRDGRVVRTDLPIPDTSVDDLIRLMVGREISDLYGTRVVAIGEKVLSAKNLRTVDGAVADASFDLRAGEILGVAGLVGSGKSEPGLARAGCVNASGVVEARGKRLRLGVPRASIHHGIAFVPEDRRKSGILPNRSVRHNLSAAWNREIAPRGVVRLATEKRRVTETMAAFRIKAPSLETQVSKLSGGNQQKVVLGRWFVKRLPSKTRP